MGPSCPLSGLASLISPTPYQIIPESLQCPLLLHAAPESGLPPSRPHCKEGSLISLHPVTEGEAGASNQTLPPPQPHLLTHLPSPPLPTPPPPPPPKLLLNLLSRFLVLSICCLDCSLMSCLTCLNLIATARWWLRTTPTTTRELGAWETILPGASGWGQREACGTRHTGQAEAEWPLPDKAIVMAGGGGDQALSQQGDKTGPRCQVWHRQLRAQGLPGWEPGPWGLGLMLTRCLGKQPDRFPRPGLRGRGNRAGETKV